MLFRSTGRSAAIAGRDVAGKTGTTSDYKDAWFAGYSGGFTTVVWMGRDDGASMGRITGGSAPAELWRGFMTVALKRVPAQAIPAGPPAPAPPPAPLEVLVPVVDEQVAEPVELPTQAPEDPPI